MELISVKTLSNYSREGGGVGIFFTPTSRGGLFWAITILDGKQYYQTFPVLRHQTKEQAEREAIQWWNNQKEIAKLLGMSFVEANGQRTTRERRRTRRQDNGSEEEWDRSVET